MPIPMQDFFTRLHKKRVLVSGGYLHSRQFSIIIFGNYRIKISVIILNFGN
jgi:hypothetical protein